MIKHKKKGVLNNQRGQTTIEYLMLMGMAFVVAFIMTTGPFSNFAAGMLSTIHNNIHNIVRTGEITEGGVLVPEDAGHPSDPARFQALHL